MSRQVINQQKSQFFIHPKAKESVANDINKLTGFVKGNFPSTYLGAPIYIGKKKVEFFNDISAKVSRRIQGWNGKMMSFGGKAVLIKAVLYSIPMHILSAVNPPKSTLTLLENQCANFFWGNTNGEKKHHWFKWDSLCYATEQGGAGFRSIHDINKAFSTKAWWNFRTSWL